MKLPADQFPVVIDQPKQAISIRLDKSILDYYRATGPLWQRRINADLAFVVAQRKAATRKGAK